MGFCDPIDFASTKWIFSAKLVIRFPAVFFNHKVHKAGWILSAKPCVPCAFPLSPLW